MRAETLTGPRIGVSAATLPGIDVAKATRIWGSGRFGCLEMAFKMLGVAHADGGVAAAISHLANASQGGNAVAIDQHANP